VSCVIIIVMRDSSKLIIDESLKGYFYKSLSEINKKSLCPVPEETIYYSSEVLDKYSHSSEFFDMSNGQVREKILGKRLLEASQLSAEMRKREYKDIADSALVLTGYFSKSIDTKILDASYYIQIGKTAYDNMNSLAPRCYDIPSFYKMMSTCFENLIRIMMIFGEHNFNQFSSSDELAKLIMAIKDDEDKKVS
jgi:hypothetical protein